MLQCVGSNLAIFKFEPTTPNTSQQGGQTHANMLQYVALACCDHLAGALEFKCQTRLFRSLSGGSGGSLNVIVHTSKFIPVHCYNLNKLS